MKLEKEIRYCFVVKNEAELKYIFSIFKKQDFLFSGALIDNINLKYLNQKENLKKYHKLWIYYTFYKFNYEFTLDIGYDDYNETKKPTLL